MKTLNNFKSGFSFLAATLLTILCLSIVIAPAHAREVIHKFDAKIDIQPNGDLIVRETIEVTSEGRDIRRGIYRDIPLYFEDRNGVIRKVGFEIRSIRRDGENEDYHTESFSNYIRIYLGNKDVFLKNGRHIYEIEYWTDRQLRLFDTHEELFWNVTGTEWIFEIEKASATINLPEGVIATDTTYFTGRHGSKLQDADSQILSDGQKVRFFTVKPLGAREGLTIGVKMPSGSFATAIASKQSGWFFRDYRSEVIAAFTLLFVAAYYSLMWWRVGRDPEGGAIVPRWDTPETISPALANYIEKKGFGSNAWQALISAILNLAVRGYVTIEELNDKPTIERTDKAISGDLPVGERALVKYLDGRSSRSIRAIKSQGTSIKVMHAKFKDAIEGEHRKAYYEHNWGWIILGLVFSVAGLLAAVISGGFTEQTFAIVFPVIFGSIFVGILANRISASFRSGGSLLSNIFSLVFNSFIGIFVMGGAISGLSQVTQLLTQPILLFIIAALVGINVLFFFLLGAPTSLGRERMDVLEGLKTYINLAEKDRMNLAGAPKMSPQHYETLLPYAVAMGLEKPWSNSFQSWLLTAAAAGAGAAAMHYGPRWYRGDFEVDNIGDTFGKMSDNMQSSFTASLPAPKSSSSGFSSGGSSGGGGGGGGGGGW